MAVSFKVPKSPKRDIFVIDNFMGVDLTNTGSNIDETRSPNAENMVRYVPGKVRKRMGYSVPVEFSDGKDVNRAINTSDEYVDIEFDENGDIVYTMYDDHTNKCFLHFWLSYVGDYTIYVVNKDNSSWSFQAVATEEEPMEDESRVIYNYDCAPYGGYSHLKIHKNSSGENDYCKIKSLRMSHATHATTRSEYSRGTAWKPAPEDEGRKFILTSETRPVYGHHTLRTGKKQGDFVTNVNRALGTSDEYVTYTWSEMLYKLGETIPEEKTVHVHFDYDCTSSYAEIIACISGINSAQGDVITTIYSGTGTYDEDYTAEDNFSFISLVGYGGDNEVKIKNFSLCYAVDDDFEWKAAPEDSGAVFDIDSVYQTTGDNTAIYTSYTDDPIHINVTSAYILDTVAIQQSTTAVKNALTIIEFDFSFTANKTVGGTQLEELPIESCSVMCAGSEIAVFYEKPVNQHIITYVYPGSSIYFDCIDIYTVLTAAPNANCINNISVQNLRIHEGIEKTDFWSSEYINLFHVGKNMYVNKSGKDDYDLIYGDMNQQRSLSWQFEAKDNDSVPLGHDNLYIVDGKTYLEYDSATDSIRQINGIGRVPVVTTSKTPSGGGNPYYPINRLQPGFEEWFTGDGTAVIYQLSFNSLDYNPHVRVWLQDQNEGTWFELEEGVDFEVNYNLGQVKFATAPWDAASTTGEDNVKIRAFRTVTRYVDSINKCSFGTLFGVGGTSDRLFLSGNPDYPNYDFFSADYDPTYFPDTNYATLGVGSSEIKGYARVNNYLATFKDENEPSQSVFIREGDLIVNSTTNVSEPAFKLINTLQGNGAISPYTFGYLQTEPLFLTKSGVYAITAQDITGEKYGQSRSFYLNGKLLKEDNLSNACAVVYNDQYLLAINGNLYVLDGLQATRTDRSDPYATRQYVGFFCTNIPANVMWTYNDALWFGTLDGRICEFATDVESLDSYNDDGEAIYCCWETPDLDGKLFYKNKTFRYFAIRMMSAIKTSVQMWSQRLGEWTFIKETAAISKIFDFNDIDFNLFTFRSDNSEKVAHAKIRVKKVDKARFRLENGKLNEPFGLFDLALEYIESGNYKR